MTVTITFLGASGTVTGSKYLIQGAGKRILVDGGMFQGERRWREENWIDQGIDLKHIDAVLLTHAHIDHTGILPRYFAEGLSCPIYATPATSEMSRVLLLDAARLQEEEAQYRAERGKSRHKPPLPLYRERDAMGVATLFRDVPYHQSVEIFRGVTATWRRMGHILGAASIELSIGGKTITFSGDIGRYTVPILKDPEAAPLADLLLVESTYGDKLHDPRNPLDELAAIINETSSRGGLVLIPSFAVGRTQLLLFYIRQLKEQKRIPDLPVIIDSPLAEKATQLYGQFTDDYDDESISLLRRGIKPFSPPKLKFTQDKNDSIRLNSIHEPMILMAGSGMLSGGRILHHLKHRLPSPLNTLLFVGYQPEGGRGDWLKHGHDTATILGEEVPVRAKIADMSGLSAHGDRAELLRWCKSCTGSPGKVFVVHGETGPASSFRELLIKEKNWNVSLAQYKAEVVI